MYYGVLKDVKKSVSGPCYEQKDMSELKKVLNVNYDQLRKFKLKGLSKALGRNLWLMGDQLMVIDFVFVEVLRFMIVQEKELELNQGVSAFQNLVDYVERFNSLERIGLYRESHRHLERRFNGWSAIWG